MGYREACRFYGVPFATVHDRLSGKVAIDKKPKVGPNPVLGVEGEAKLTKWILDMAKCGFPISKQGLLESVSKIIAKTGIKTPFKYGMPGDTWYQKFLKRHPEISIREPEGINNARAAITENRIRHWFKDLRNYIMSIDAMDIFEDPDRIFNGDETGFSLCPKSGKVLGPKGYKNLFIIKKNNEKENITVLLVFSASGKLCPPLVIFPYVRPPKALVNNMPESWVLGRSESGWMKSDVFFEYVTNDYNDWLIKNNVKKPILLFIDGHKSHMTYALSEFCEANDIILYALPPNSTHMLQPADVSVFRPLKQNWKNIVKKSDQAVTKFNFCSILNNTLSQTELKDAIRNGFRKCGLYPVNEDNVDYTKCVKDTQLRVEKERREKNSRSNKKTTATAKEFDAAMKVISIIKNELSERNIDSEVVLKEIEISKATYLQNRRSKSKTPRNSAASDLSTSILPIEMLAMFDEPETNMVKDDEDPQAAAPNQLTTNMTTDITPENLSFEETETKEEQGVSQLFKSTDLDHSNLLASNENITLPDPGSYISLNNISVIPLDEIEISHQAQSTQLLITENENQCYTLNVTADIHNDNNENSNETPMPIIDKLLSFDEVFEHHLHFPEPKASPKTVIRQVKLPSAISSQAWRNYYKKKDEEKENIQLEKKLKQQLKEEEKKKKADEKEKKKKKKVLSKKNINKKDTLLCSECAEELISDVEDDLEKNIGCDVCIRWFHLKCTEMREKSYFEAALTTYKCSFCQN
ncbi:uncharacterized protein LOC135309805 [Plodia interpunctella]|uniref:uncharacterized protein LOC135309805 n=1 Tax=Plodia interpunctella TaxID=58824 RepID=UPI00310188DE